MVAGFLGAQAPFPARNKGRVPLGTDRLTRASVPIPLGREGHLIPSERDTLFRTKGESPFGRREMFPSGVGRRSLRA